MRYSMKHQRVILTVSEISEYLRVHRSTVYRLLRTHQLPAFKIGSDWRFSVDAVDRWLKNIEAGGSAMTTDERAQASDVEAAETRTTGSKSRN
jgi:excisionase family DNA binding protein